MFFFIVLQVYLGQGMPWQGKGVGLESTWESYPGNSKLCN